MPPASYILKILMKTPMWPSGLKCFSLLYRVSQEPLITVLGLLVPTTSRSWQGKGLNSVGKCCKIVMGGFIPVTGTLGKPLFNTKWVFKFTGPYCIQSNNFRLNFKYFCCSDTQSNMGQLLNCETLVTGIIRN